MLGYRAFGKTGLNISPLSFGGGAVGGLLIDADDDTRRQALLTAFDAGINWIDTAPSYGQGKSEDAIGALLEDMDANPYISTKFVIDTRNLSDISGQIHRSLEESLKRLKRDAVTLLQLHNPIGQVTGGRTLGIAEILRSHGVLDTLETLKNQGLIHLCGITALGETMPIIKILKSNRLDSAQVYFNMLNPSAAFTPPPSWPCYNFTGIMDTCREHDVAVMNIRVFSAGVLATDERTGKERPLTPGDTVETETEKARAIFALLGNDYGTSAQTALRFALAEEKIATTVLGLASIDHLQEALAGASMGPLPMDAMERIRAAYTGYPTGQAS